MQPDERGKARKDQDAMVHPHKSNGLMMQQTETVTAPDTGVNGVTNGPKDNHPATHGKMDPPGFSYQYCMWHILGTEHVYI